MTRGPRHRERAWRGPGWAGVAACALALAGCASPVMDRRAAAALEGGRYGEARVRFEGALTKDRSDRNYILDRMRLLVASLADGDPWASEEAANETFSLLRTQGLNADKTVSSVVVNEGVKTWKGEPFEQAMSYAYIAIQKGMRGEWDNARAAANASLFLLKDFGENERGEKLSTEELARRAAERGKGGDEYLDKGYVAARTDFALGYLLSGIASHALGRDDEASDNWNEAARLNPALGAVRDALMSGRVNTVLVVDAGKGPRKVATGPDGAIARFEAMTVSGDRLLAVRVEGEGGAGESERVAWACDVNGMSRSHLWNNLEDVRIAKSVIGDVLLKGGVIVAATANQRDSRQRATQQLIGLGMMAVGALSRAGAHADTRHLELLPERVYVVPLRIEGRGMRVTVEVEGEASSRLVLAGLGPPREGERVQLRYAKLPLGWSGGAWATSGRVVYANDWWGERVEGDDLPYILGGRCVCRPTGAVLERYQSAGRLSGMTLVELENLYRAEGIALTPEDANGRSRVHVLEGGDTLVSPLPGTAGYARLFGQEHGAYRPRSRELREWLERNKERVGR